MGGHSEGNETPEQTLARELDEELGITVTKFSLMDVISNARYDLHVFLVTGWVGMPRIFPTATIRSLDGFP